MGIKRACFERKQLIFIQGIHRKIAKVLFPVRCVPLIPCMSMLSSKHTHIMIMIIICMDILMHGDILSIDSLFI